MTKNQNWGVKQALGVITILIAVVTTAAAQNRPFGSGGQQGQGQGNRVCLYPQANYGGQPLCINAGDSISDLQTAGAGWNDRVASIRLFGNARATIYQDSGFGGAAYLVTSDVPDLGSIREGNIGPWSRHVSSVRVEFSGSGGSGGSGGGGGPSQGDRICLYEQANYRGQSVCFNPGDNTSDFQTIPSGNFNDRVGSIRVFGNVQATIYQHVGFGGTSYLVSSDIPNMAQLRDGGVQDWSREVSAMRVERRGGQFPSDPTGPTGPAGPTGPTEGDRACFYARPNYGGRSLCIGVGDQISDLRSTAANWNDRVASIRVFGNARTTIFEDVGFAGASYVVTNDVPNLAQLRDNELRNWRRDVSSIRVTRSRGGADQTYSDAYRLGEQDFQQGRPQNYRTYRGRYDRSNEREFQQDYDRGYTSSGRGGDRGSNPGRDDVGDGGDFTDVNAAYSGVGQLQIGTQSQPVTDVLVRLLRNGVAQFDILGDRGRVQLSGTWARSGRGPIQIAINQGFGRSVTTGTGRVSLRNGILRNIELTGQTNRQNFSLSFRDDDSGWGRGGSTGAERPRGTAVHRGAITNRGSGKALDVADRSTMDGANIQQWDYTRQPNQTWQIIDLGGGEVAIIAEHSNKALTVQGAREFNGANIVQREWRNIPHQRWRLEQVGGGFVRIVNVGSGKVLDVAGQARENGANIQQWDYANQQNQQWRLTN
jgi:hypothetical protein